MRENPALLEAENRALLPTQFEVLLVRDLAGKFSGRRTFVEHLEEAVPYFYEQVGQYLRAYVAPPPRLRKEAEEAKKADEPLEAVADEAAAAASEAVDSASTTRLPGNINSEKS